MTGDRRDRGAERRRVLGAVEADDRTSSSDCSPADGGPAGDPSPDGGRDLSGPDPSVGIDRALDSQVVGSHEDPRWECHGCERRYHHRPESCVECGSRRIDRREEF